ncbi:MAG: 2-oxoglutarate dehydrogenase complex dihydrolipoyllysine-residue succinyltransferase [Gammaproteobacteria bacterium]|nr:2-oxoglutarate dehydrogenase complex dihydrolipoyllysine-residue succinyltransferase [Gammaproteobacteria bacterium]
MLVEVKVPVLAESVAEATLMNWHKNIGDTVNRGDSLIDIETDKVTLEVAAPNNGILTQILKQGGEEVYSDEVIARIETEISEAKTVEVPISIKTAAPPLQQSLPDIEPLKQTDEPKLSPAVRNLLHQHQLNAADIPASSTDGRLTKEDVLKHIERTGAVQKVRAAPAPKTEQPKQAPVSTPKSAPQPQPVAKKSIAKSPVQTPMSGDRAEERVPMTRLRKRAAERLLMAQHENAILTTFNEVNMQPVIDLRNRYKEEFEKIHGVKLGLMSFFTKATVEALKKFPVINASVDGEDIIYHGFFDIGIAVSSPRGLVVPIIRDADEMSFAAIETRIREYGEKARDSKLTIEDLTGGTFTITNGGVFGSLLSTPIINPPQSAILGMHKMQERPVAEKGQVVIRQMMYLALSYDHRIIDGREAVQFLVSIKEQIEDPTRLLLQV